jgi:hypothetical protein
LPQTDGEYDWEADAKGCWAEAIRVVGERVKAGDPVPAFFLSSKS